MEKTLNQLVERLKTAYGDGLVSVVLYGSAAAGDHHQKFSDLNVICVLRQITPAELDASFSIFRWWREQSNPAPLLLTENEFRTSSDCFAIEFHDIVAQHQVLYGKNVVEGLELDKSFYRAQVEHDLRAKLLRLRQKAAGMLADTDLLRRLLADSLSTFCVLFRHALILSGVEASHKKREVIEQARVHFGIDATPLASLLDLREERVKPKDVDPVPLLATYMAAISQVIDVVDRIEK